MRRLILCGAIFCLAMLMAMVVVAAPQRKGTATLQGVVIGPDDKPAGHASIMYQSGAGNSPHAVYADRQGHFLITKLRGDNYDLRASARGVFSAWEKNVMVRPGQVKTVTLRLIYAKEIPKTGSARKQKR